MKQQQYQSHHDDDTQRPIWNPQQFTFFMTTPQVVGEPCAAHEQRRVQHCGRRRMHAFQDFVDALKKYTGVAYVYGSLHYQRVVEAGQRWAANSFQKSSDQIKDFVGDDKKLTQWVLSCPLMPRHELIQSLSHLDMMDDTGGIGREP